MIKAGTLYMVIIISLLIGMISMTLLTIAFFYKQQEQKKTRLDRLASNMESATAIILGEGFINHDQDMAMDLYGNGQDSVLLNKSTWGVFEMNTIKAFERNDTVKRAFLSANKYIDQTAIYLADEDRPLSLSGDTRITGVGEVPKAGLRKSYVEGKAYSGKELITGEIKNSSRELPLLNEALVNELTTRLENSDTLQFLEGDSIHNSFFNDTQVYKIRPDEPVLTNIDLKGKIILISDTVLTIKADAILENVQIYAPSIIVVDGFKGSCQLFARDSVVVGKDCDFNYPSFIGVFKPEDGKLQAKIQLGEQTNFSGILFTYEKERSDLQTLISLEKDCLVKGEIYATGYVKLSRPLEVNGKVSAKRFIMQTPATLYENYLIDVVFNRKLLSKYYLSSSLFKREHSEQEILKWLE